MRNYIWSDYKGWFKTDYSGDMSYLYEVNAKDFSEVSRRLFEFIFLCNYLEVNKLIFAIGIASRNYKPIFVFFDETQILPNQPIEWYKVNQLVTDRYKWEFFASAGLEDFVRNGYLTEQKIKENEEKEHRKRSEFWTRFTALTALVAVIVSIILQIVFNSKERDVIINNRNAFQDTTKIFLLNPTKGIDTKQEKDSIRK